MKLLFLTILIPLNIFSQIENSYSGIKTSLRADNSLASKIEYKNGEPNGMALIFDGNGKLWEEGTFVNRKWIGNYKLYHSNGKIHQDFNFDSKGVKNGRQRFYHENGILKNISACVDGKADGYVLEFDKLGALLMAPTFYVNGEQIFNYGNNQMLLALLEIVNKENEAARKLK